MLLNYVFPGLVFNQSSVPASARSLASERVGSSAIVHASAATLSPNATAGETSVSLSLQSGNGESSQLVGTLRSASVESVLPESEMRADDGQLHILYSSSGAEHLRVQLLIPEELKPPTMSRTQLISEFGATTLSH